MVSLYYAIGVKKDTVVIGYCEIFLIVTLLSFPNSVTIPDYHCILYNAIHILLQKKVF